MKVFIVSLVIAAVCLSAVQAEAKAGECSLKEYANKVFPCHTNLIHSLQKNPTSDCSTETQVFIDCGAKAISSCFPTLSESYVKDLLRKTSTKEFYCNNAGLQSPIPPGSDPDMKVCGTSFKAYADRVNACADKMVKMWRANRSDKGLCSEYANVKQCQISVAKTDLACLDKELNNMLDQYYGESRNYNPFCASGVDPSGSSSSLKPSSSLFLSITVVAMVVLWFVQSG